MNRWLNSKRVWISAALLATVAVVGTALLSDGQTATAAPQDSSPVSKVDPAVLSHAKSLSMAFRHAAEVALPAVVTIENRPHVDAEATTGTPRGLRDPFFRRFFGELPEMPELKRPPRQNLGAGSGVVIDSSGVILTNNHVVAGGGKITVRLHSGEEFVATDVKTDPQTDLAIVRIDAGKPLVAAQFGDSQEMQIGDWVLALGQPFGLQDSVTAGIISAKGRGIGITRRESFLQTDAAINPGNSGGPLINLDGHVVGINTAISSRSGGNEGIGFAVPINLAKWVAGQLQESGVVRRAYLGVAIQPVTQELADQLGVAPREGVVVNQVFPDTPAAKTGLKSGDVILDFNGQRVSNPRELQSLVERAEIGKKYPLSVARDGKNIKLQFSAAAQPEKFGVADARKASPQPAKKSVLGKLGLEVEPLTPEVAEHLGVDVTEGVLITRIQSDGPASAAGLKAGMVITQANRQPVESVAALQAAVKASSPEKGLLLLVHSGEGSQFVVLKW